MRICVAFAVFRLGTQISPPTVSVECLRVSWRKAGLWSAYTAAAEGVLDNPFTVDNNILVYTVIIICN